MGPAGIYHRISTPITAGSAWASIKSVIESLRGSALSTTENDAGFTLVSDLFGVSNSSYSTLDTWKKHKGLFGVLGGTAATHSVNWKNPQSAAARLAYYGTGTTHSATGIQWSGTGYADTGIIPDQVFSLAAGTSLGLYNRTSAASGGDKVDMGVIASVTSRLLLSAQNTVSGAGKIVARNLNNTVLGTSTGGLGYIQSVRLGNAAHSIYKGIIQEVTGGDGNGDLGPMSIWIGALNNGGSAYGNTTREQSFYAISDGLTTAEANAVNNAIEAYQLKLGRFAYDTDAAAYLTATGIPDDGTVLYGGTAQATTGRQIWLTTNTFYVNMKAAGLYALLAAYYPMTGGTAARHRLNGLNPATYLLTYNGTSAHDGQGMNANASSADLGLVPSAVLSQNSTGLTVFSQNDVNATAVLCGASDAGYANGLYLLPGSNGGIDYSRANGSVTNSVSADGMKGTLSIMRTSASAVARYRNTTRYYNSTSDTSSGLASVSLRVGALNRAGVNDLPCGGNMFSAIAVWNTGLTQTQHNSYNTLEHQRQAGMLRDV